MIDDGPDDLRRRLAQAERLILEALRTLADVGQEEALLASEEHLARHRAALEQLQRGQENLEQLGALLRAQHGASTTRH